MKKLAILMSLIMVFGVMSPALASDEMTEVLTSVKSRIYVPEECSEFQIYPQMYDGKKSWSLNWSTPGDTDDYKHVSAEVMENQVITQYYLYEGKSGNEPFYGNKRLPSYSEDEAVLKAKAYFEGINPSIAALYDFSQAEVNVGIDAYSVNVPRVENGIIVTYNSAYISINHQSGKLLGMSASYDEGVSFPVADGVITAVAASEAFKANNGLELIYTTFYDYEENKNGKVAKIVFAPTGKGSVIDAFTGEAVDISNNIGIYRDAMMGAGASESANKVFDSASIRLTEQEVKSIEDMSGLISAEEAVDMIMAMPELDMPEGVDIRSSRVMKYDDKYVISLNFDNGGREDYKGGSAWLNAQNGELISFYSYNDVNSTEGERYSRGDASSAIETFLGKYLGDYAANIKYREENSEIIENKSSYNAYYYRMKNGLPYYQNNISVTVDTATLKVTNYNFTWDNSIVFEDADGLVDGDVAYDALFAAVSPQLGYTLEKSGDKVARLVYHINTNGISYIDAKTGVPLDFDGKEYKEPAPIVYTDLEGHYAKEAIEALVQIGVHIEGEQFLPNNIITQNEFLQLVSKCVWDFYPMYGGRVDADSIYRNAISNGVIKKGEEAPDDPLTRELAVMYLLRAMGFKHFAEINGIFKSSFIDQNDIAAEMFGYVAIAEGLDIIKGSGGSFMPKSEMTRAEAATMLYNYLKK